MGVHISKVKSVNLDSWSAEQVAMMMEMGNSRARAVYEANVPDGFRRPQTDSRSLENFIRAKYEQKKYIAREWIPPKPSIPKELQLEDKVDKRKARAKTSGVQLSSIPKPASHTTNNASTPEDISPPPKPAENKSQSSKNSEDLLGLEMSPSKQANTQSSDLLGDLNDFMGVNSQPDLCTSSTSQPHQNGTTEPNLFVDPSSQADKVPEKSTKDSIMALFGPTGTPQQQQQQQQFGVPGGVYMPQTSATPAVYGIPGGMPAHTAGMMYQQPQQGMMAIPQQPGMYGGMMPQQGTMGMSGVPQGNMAMYGQQPPQMQQQIHFQQMQQQMSAMRMGGGAMMGQPSGVNWSPQTNTGQTLSTNLWQ